MTQRERFLAIIVGGLFGVVALQWAINQYRSAVSWRQNRLNSLTSEADDLQAQWLAGAEAERQLGEYKVRSLSSDPEVAQSQFQSWLLETVGKIQPSEQAGSVGLVDAVVDPVSDVPVGDLYRRFSFRVSGKTTLAGVVDLIHRIQSHDQLHRIRELSFSPVRKSIRRESTSQASESDLLSVVLMIDAISLDIADEQPAPPSAKPSWRISTSLADTRETILNRNFFSPPNQPPVYEGKDELVAVRGQSNELRLDFKDPENQAVRIEVQGELPEWATWDPQAARMRVSPPVVEKSDGGEPAADGIEKFEVEVTATDDGYPRRQVTQTLVIRTQDAPPAPPPSTPPPGFDDSTQTFLTALVQGDQDWTAWMSVRTKGKTLKLKVGDEFEIGTVQGKVIEVNSRRVMLEIDNERFELRPAEKLSDRRAEG